MASDVRCNGTSGTGVRGSMALWLWSPSSICAQRCLCTLAGWLLQMIGEQARAEWNEGTER